MLFPATPVAFPAATDRADVLPSLTLPQDTSSGGEETEVAAGAEPAASMLVAPLAAAAMPEVAPF
jgi:hypothetical protein